MLIFAIFAVGFQCVLKSNSKTIDNFLIRKEEKAQEKKIEKIRIEKGEEEVKKIRNAQEIMKISKLESQQNPEITPIEIQKSGSYKKAWGSINAINRIALWMRSRDDSTVDDPSSQNAYNGDFLEGMFFLTSMFSPSTFNNLLNLDADGVYYASMEAMYDPDIRWETKYFIAQMLGEREERRALPLFRDIVADNNGAFLVRITSIDQIGNLEDKESNDLVLSLLDDEIPIMRNKASAILRDTAEKGDEYTYELVLAHYWNEQDLAAKDCLLGTAIDIGGEKSFSDVQEILKIANKDEKETIALMLGDIHSQESFRILKELYNPDSKDSSLVIMSLANLEMEEANEFLYGIIVENNDLLSVMAAEYLKDHKQINAISYIEEALRKEQNPEFIKNYQETLVQLRQHAQ